ncbi:MAG: HD domain-containing protein [Acidimicrobiia bacterium]|nr:HD domain-containing protein [Acidimicrobiia bacterium]
MTSRLAHVGHLARRFVGSLSRRPPTAPDVAWVDRLLSRRERALWGRMGPADRRHSIEVARRFVAIRPAATRTELAAALLHDVGKVESGLGPFGRVVATVVGARQARFRRYHDHEVIGARLAAAAGADPVTVALIEGRGPAGADLESADTM